jgi:hypothetical protein
LPAAGFVRVRGLPPATSLSEGHALGPGAWAVPVAALSRLHLKAAANATGTSRLTFTLVAAGGELLAEANTVLVIWGGPPGTRESIAARSRTQDPDAERLGLRHTRTGLGKLAATTLRDVPPRVAMPHGTARKGWIRHIAKRHQQLAAKVRRPTVVRTVKDTVGRFPSS